MTKSDKAYAHLLQLSDAVRTKRLSGFKPKPKQPDVKVKEPEDGGDDHELMAALESYGDDKHQR